jgi:hypothetical protein
MRDILVGFVFIAMVLTPALVASFQRRSHHDE